MPTTNTQIEAKNLLAKLAKANSQKHRVDAEVEKKFLHLCELADILGDEFGAEEIQIIAEPSGLHGLVFIDTDEVIFDNGRSHQFFEYLKSADLLGFSKTKTGMLRIRLGVKDLWVRA